MTLCVYDKSLCYAGDCNLSPFYVFENLACLSRGVSLLYHHVHRVDEDAYLLSESLLMEDWALVLIKQEKVFDL